MFTRAIVILFVMLSMLSFSGQAIAVTEGTTDGIYDFGQLGEPDSMGIGTGFTQLGDKFKVENLKFDQWQRAGSDPIISTSIYLIGNLENDPPQTAIIRAEGSSTCKTFTFRDLGLSADGELINNAELKSISIVFKGIDNLPLTGSSITLGESPTIPTDRVIQLSSLYDVPPWSVTGVATVEITFQFLRGYGAFYLNLEDITIADVSADVSADVQLTVTISGSGSVNSYNTTGTNYACNKVSGGICDPMVFGYNDTVTLSATGSNSTFSGWSGACTGTTSPCSFPMHANKAVTATFALLQYVKNGTNYYSSLQDAFYGAATGNTIQAQALVFTDLDLVFNRPAALVTFKGGYDSTFATNSGYTTLDGKLSVRGGTLRMEKLKIK
jgi:hypothetical protein